MSATVSYTKQFVFGLLFVMIVIVVFEGIARIIVYELVTCPLTKSGIYDGVNKDLLRNACIDGAKIVWNLDTKPPMILPNQHFGSININSGGFRGPEIAEQKPDNTYRIFVVGGSTTYGSGALSDNSTIPGYLQQEFNRANFSSKVQVINAGSPGAFSLTETMLVKNKILYYKPDLLIIYTGWNDVVRPLSLENDYDLNISFLSKVIQTLHRYIPFYTTPNTVVSLLYDLRLQYEINHHAIHKFDNTGINEKVRLWQDRWIDICNLGRQKGFDTLIVLQPLVGTGSKVLTEAEQQNFEFNDLSNMNQSYQSFADGLKGFDGCTKTVDLRNGFDGVAGPIFYDTGHVGDKGNGIIAKKLYELSLPIMEQKLHFKEDVKILKP